MHRAQHGPDPNLWRRLAGAECAAIFSKFHFYGQVPE
jgi:hypothetical protein